eukprot:Gb_03048 [translate_table: standard]
MGEADEAEGVKNSSARPSDSSRSMGINGTFDPSTLDTLKSRSRKSRKEEWDNNCTDIDDILNGGVDETALGDDATVVYDSGGSHSDENVRRVSEWSRRSCFRKSYWKTGGGPRRSWLKFQPDKKQLRLCRDALAESLKGVYAFNFQKRHARLDWRILHAIDVDQILRDTDIDKLEAVLDTIAFGNIIEEDTRNFTESNFIKIFRLSQLMVEYLLHVQEILVAHKTKLMEAGLELQNQGEKYRNRCALQEEALVQARRELKQLKKTVSTYEALLRSKEAVPTPASVPVFPPQPPTPRQAHHCPFCDKVFETVVYLDLHIARRHPKATDNLLEQKISAAVTKAEESTAARLKTETEALQNEVQRLRAASQINIPKSEAATPCQVALLQSSLHENSEKLRDVQHQLQMLQTMLHPLNPRMDKSERLEEKKAEVAHET